MTSTPYDESLAFFANPGNALVERINRLADERGPEAATGLLVAWGWLAVEPVNASGVQGYVSPDGTTWDLHLLADGYSLEA